MSDNCVRRVAIKFWFLIGHRASDTVGILSSAYKKHGLNRTKVFQLYSCFKRGEMLPKKGPIDQIGCYDNDYLFF